MIPLADIRHILLLINNILKYPLSFNPNTMHEFTVTFEMDNLKMIIFLEIRYLIGKKVKSIEFKDFLLYSLSSNRRY